jgi:hypothetical protein
LIFRILGLGRSAGFGGLRGSHACDWRWRTSGVRCDRVGAKVRVSSCDVALCTGARRRANKPCIMAVPCETRGARKGWSVTYVKCLKLSFDAGRGVQSHDGISSARQMPDGRPMSVRGGSFQFMLPLRPKTFYMEYIQAAVFIQKAGCEDACRGCESRTKCTMVLHSRRLAAFASERDVPSGTCKANRQQMKTFVSFLL